MKTDDLVLMLATGAGVAPKHVAAVATLSRLDGECRSRLR